MALLHFARVIASQTVNFKVATRLQMDSDLSNQIFLSVVEQWVSYQTDPLKQKAIQRARVWANFGSQIGLLHLPS